MNAFDILMVIAVGSLIGTGIGLTIGSIVKKRGSTAGGTWSDITLNSTLAAVCSCISIAGLASVFLA
ncbi:MAG: hypothetical protein WC294_03515 [Methanoregula sp.]|jgi:amino acid permease